MGIVRDVLSVLIPGGGAYLRRRYLKAAVVFVVFLALLQAYILLAALRPAGVPEYVKAALLAGMLAVVVANAVAEVYHLARRRHFAAGGRAEELYRRALCAYIVGDDRKAEDSICSALRLDDLNADFLFLRAQVSARLGKTRRARRLFSKCRSFDENGKWKWEIESALERFSAPAGQ